MRRLCMIIAIAALAAGLAPPSAAELRVVATTSDLAALARAVAGEAATVESLTAGASDPHHAAARPSMIRTIYRADLLLVVGADLEIGWLPAALRAGRNGRVLPGARGYLDLSEHVRLLETRAGPVDRSMGDVHAKGNPHYLLDPENGRRAARAIAGRMAMLDAANAAVFRRNLAAFEAMLDARLPAWRARLAPLQGTAAISYHKTFSYLAEAFGFRIVDQVEPLPGIAPTASHLERLVDRIRRDGIRLLIMAPYYERRSAALLERHTGIRTAVLPQAVGAREDIRDYPALFDAITGILADAVPR